MESIDIEPDLEVPSEDNNLSDELGNSDADISIEMPILDNPEEDLAENVEEISETIISNSNKQSNISNLEINLDNTIRVIQEALANGQKVEVHVIDEEKNQINNEEKRKIYTIK